MEHAIVTNVAAELRETNGSEELEKNT